MYTNISHDQYNEKWNNTYIENILGITTNKLRLSLPFLQQQKHTYIKNRLTDWRVVKSRGNFHTVCPFHNVWLQDVRFLHDP